MKRTQISLSKLRDIGWAEWDPIGLLDSDEQWNQQSFADEYDTYLMQAVARLRQGASENEVISYLIDIERDYMGIGMQQGTTSRATRTVRRIQKELEISTEST
ncbi:hypothetical protein [Pseudovibrio brasiliensis]|uniref:Uncharacterized protein n=1 Tax=Pseudovibrio brasiliensis TaxID=1898042 RepID=A0ABX8AUM5_9HYPH|nr:hypothetical protein [Pseudovibrio brasiliensis]QUS58792.1 hypothetical protein KGB56_25675 [Pseudovibrio brasiliensis]